MANSHQPHRNAPVSSHGLGTLDIFFGSLGLVALSTAVLPHDTSSGLDCLTPEFRVNPHGPLVSAAIAQCCPLSTRWVGLAL